MKEYNDYAGKYLKSYETKRYPSSEHVEPQGIIVSPDAEQFADVSFYQGEINWDKYSQHARGAILRIGQNTWKDNKFERNYSEGKRVGMVLGGYYFFDGRASPSQQAKVIIDAMADKHLEMELFIDWELNYGGNWEGLPNVVSLMQSVENAGVKCKAVGIYTGYYYFGEHTNPSENANQYVYLKQKPLWLAWYSSASDVKVPPPWTELTHWQYGTPKVDWGQVSTEIDMNKHNGTRADFEARYLEGTTPVPTPPPANGLIKEGTLTPSTASLRVRSGPAITFPQIAGVLKGDKVYGVLDVDSGWLKIQWIVRTNGTRQDIDGWCTGNKRYITLVDFSTNPPSPPPTGTDVIEVYVNGVRTIHVVGKIL